MSRRADVAWSQQLTRFSGSQFVLWASAASIAIVAHAGVASWVMQAQASVPVEAAGGSPAIMIDLAPTAMAPASVEDQIAPDLVDSVATDAPPTPFEAEPVEPVETAISAEPVPVEPEVQPDPEPIEPVEIAKAVDVMPVPAEPVEEAVEVTEPVDPIEEFVTTQLENIEVPIPMVRPEPPREQAQPQPQSRKQQQKAASPSRDAARAKVQTQQEAPRTAAPQTNSGAASVSPARWQSRLLAHLERRKRYPAEARRQRKEGTAQVRFTIDGNGNVQSVALVRSSGIAELDQEVVEMVRRASPVPAPPPGINRTIVVPVRFGLR